MKIVLVTEKQHHIQHIKDNCDNPLDLFVYDDPFKAIENLPVIRPQAIIISAHDFPRHWKPLLVMYKDLLPDGLFYLIIDAPMHKSELRKARSMAISGIIATFDDPHYDNDESLQQLQLSAEKLNGRSRSQELHVQPIQNAPALVEISPITQLFPVTVRHLENQDYALLFDTPAPVEFISAGKMIHVTIVHGDFPLHISVPVQRIDHSGVPVITCELPSVASY